MFRAIKTTLLDDVRAFVLVAQVQLGISSKG
jgi:hypothetical protein